MLILTSGGVGVLRFELSLLIKAFVARPRATKLTEYLFVPFDPHLANSTHIRRHSFASPFRFLENLIFYVKLERPPTDFKVVCFILEL